MFIESWDEFADAASRMFLADPKNTRYLMKYSHSKGLMTLKVTDNKQTIKHQTDQADQLKKIDKLNEFFLTSMSRAAVATSSDAIASQ